MAFRNCGAKAFAKSVESATGRGNRLMWWPFGKREVRESTGGYTAIISQLIEAQAVGTTQQASATAAVEAAAGLLSREFMGATVQAPDDIAAAIAPQCMALIGRDLMRVGESLHVIRMMGRAASPCAVQHLVLGRRRGPA